MTERWSITPPRHVWHPLPGQEEPGTLDAQNTGNMTPRARRFAVAAAVATFALLLVGGLVNPTGSSLACPDWPLCYGSAFPPMVGGILY